MEAAGDSTISPIQQRGLLVHRPISKERPMIKYQLPRSRIDAALTRSQAAGGSEILSVFVAEIGFRRLIGRSFHPREHRPRPTRYRYALIELPPAIA
jgi:hypothetical protein